MQISKINFLKSLCFLRKYLAVPDLSWGMWDLVPSPGMEPRELGVLAIGPPRKSLHFVFMKVCQSEYFDH